MSLVRSGLIVGLASIASKILGFVRDVLFALVLGAGPVADAFLAAFRLPNLLRRVLSEGGLNPALIPMLARLDARERPVFAGEALAGLGVVLLAVTALVQVGAGAVVLVVAPGLGGTEGAADLAALYTRTAFPVVLAVTLASLLAAVLNHARRFTAAALAPLALNGVLILVLLALRHSTELPLERQAFWAAVAASAGGFVQLAIVGLALIGHGCLIRPARPRWSRALATLSGASFATLLAGSAVHLFVLVGAQVASFLPSGVSWLYYADRLVQLPFGLIASVAGVVLMPELASRHGSGDREALIGAQNRALETGLLIAMPACVALAILAEPIASTLFERGSFGPEDTDGTVQALLGLSLALPFAVAGKILAQTLFARSATREALSAVALGLVVTSLASLVLSRGFGVLGVGLGIAAGCAAHVAALRRALGKAGLWSADARLLRRTGRILAACLCLGVSLGLLRPLLPPSGAGLLALCAGGFAVYAGAAWLLGAVTREEIALLAKKA